jgi:hypothetical protein
MDNLFYEIENSSTNIKYLFIIIPIILLFFFMKVNIKLNIMFSFIFATIIILYINYKNQKEQKDINKIYNLKKEYLRPKSTLINEYDSFVDFLFSIQDLYAYNPPAYESMVGHIESFLELYEESKIAHELAGINYGLADTKKRDAINNLHSIIYKLPGNHILVDKLNRAIEKLDDLSGDLLEEIYDINKLYILKNGYNRSSIIINKGPKPDNYYQNEAYTFELY